MSKLMLTKDEVKRVFEVANCAVDKDSMRPALQNARIAVDDSVLIVTATTGIEAVRFVMKIVEPAGERFAFCIPPYGLPKALQSAEFVLSADKNLEVIYHCADSDGWYSMPQADDCAFDFDLVAPASEEDLHIAVDAKRLMNLLKPFTKGDDPHHTVRLGFAREGRGVAKNKAVMLSGQTVEGEKLEFILMPVKEKGEFLK